MQDYLQSSVNFDTPEFASSFDELTFWSSHFGHLLLRNIELRPNIAVLDLGCGAGFPLFELAHILGNSCRVVGADVWRSALERANSKMRSYGLTNVRIVQGNGQWLPFAGSAFDLVVSNLGVNNFENPQAVMAECYRVARQGGRLALTTNINGHYREFYDVFKQVLVELNRPDYLKRLEEHEAHRGTRDSLSAMLKDAGFQVVKAVEESFQSRFLDGTAFLNHRLTKIGFIDGWRSVLDPADEVGVFGTVEAKLNEIASKEGELRMTVPMLYLEAVKTSS